LFSSKFSQRKTSPRKSSSLSNLQRDFGPQQSQAEFGLDYGPVVLNLGKSRGTFEDGKWVLDGHSSGTTSREMAGLKKQNVHLKEENNLLRLKVEILLDMLAEAMAETHLQANEIEQLKNVFVGNKSTRR